MTERLPMVAPQIRGLNYKYPLGRGGFADVFLYQQAVPNREVAVKVFVTKFEPRSPSAISFIHESDNLARLASHPNIVSIFEAAVTQDGNPYISMEYCPNSIGKNWRTNHFSLESVLDVGVQIASALETVHRNNLVHRDIKPSNLLLNSFGIPVLSDFGIASSLTGGNDQIALSLPWAAPEVVSGQSAGSVASDIFSLGATLYSLLAGRTPFESEDSRKNDNESLKARILRTVYTPIPRGGIPRIIDNFLAKTMSRDARLRFQSMQEFAMAINELQTALQFPATRLTLAAVFEDKREKYPCGHPMLANLDEGVEVQIPNTRNKKSDTTIAIDTCPVCWAAPEQKIVKRKFKVGPLAIGLIALAVIGFVVAALLISVQGS